MAIRRFTLSSDGKILPIQPPPPPTVGKVFYVIKGNEKPAEYKPEGKNIGSFDIAWLLDGKRLIKPSSFNLTKEQVEYLRWLNGYDTQKFGWLVSQIGTDKVLRENNGVYSCPVPCMSGDNPVLVLEDDKSGVFSRIATVSINEPIAYNLPDYLCHTWKAFTDEGKYFIPRGGVKYPLFARGNSSWVQRSGLVKIS